MSRDIKYIGMDVHKEAVVIAVLTRSPSENCFLKGVAATENRVVKTASQSSPHEARSNARRRASREQTSPLGVASLALFYLYP